MRGCGSSRWLQTATGTQNFPDLHHRPRLLTRRRTYVTKSSTSVGPVGLACFSECGTEIRRSITSVQHVYRTAYRPKTELRRFQFIGNISYISMSVESTCIALKVARKSTQMSYEAARSRSNHSQASRRKETSLRCQKQSYDLRGYRSTTNVSIGCKNSLPDD